MKTKKLQLEKGPVSYLAGLALITLLSFATRLYKIEEPDHVCWDETHFGKMGSWYINRTFFFDVHPPLGKMLIGLAGKLTGYNGTFAFNKPGDKYMGHSYVGMRIFCAVLGSFIAPFVYSIVHDLSKSVSTAFLAGYMIVFDVGFVTLSQYILLDPILLFFVVGSFVGSVKISTIHSESFSGKWWFWLTWTGVFLSGAVGVKFVGLFIVSVVGLQTISDLWNIFSDLGNPISLVMRHFLARIVCLIRFLSKTGSGDGFFSSGFQSQLEGNSLFNASMPRQVAYGAVVTLKNDKTGGGYLHSHWHLYPEGVGARQQQITGYSHKDENNRWRIKKFDKEPDVEKDQVEIVKHGDLVRLEHYVTSRNLHSHRELAPVSKKHYQVTCYGENGTGDANDVWRLDILGGKANDELNTVTTRFRLVHYFVNCALQCHSKQLPKWGYEQMEGNAGLKPKEGEVTSRPWQWAINIRGQYFSGNNYKIYLLGNPVIWWLNLALLFLYVIVQGVIAVRNQRGCPVSEPVRALNSKLASSCPWLFTAWFLHYVPFYTMGRVLYYHHYFPAAIFSTMLSACLINYAINLIPLVVFSRASQSFFQITYGSILAIIAYSFYLFSPLAYGIVSEGVKANNLTMSSLKWIETWEF
ncbi:Protein O-mannosyl-transferase 2 [Halotydeus destructor]|nr:Protein O-mannosyl-transferase 2 [Halotydeus destructor]